MQSWVGIVQRRVEGKLVHGADGLDVGDRVQVTLIAAEVERGYIDFGGQDGSPVTGVRSRATHLVVWPGCPCPP
jgi:hypothetical protein